MSNRLYPECYKRVVVMYFPIYGEYSIKSDGWFYVNDNGEKMWHIINTQEDIEDSLVDAWYAI